MRATAWYLVVRLLQRFLNEAQDETRVVITYQAIRKKKAYTYVLKIMRWQIFKPFIDLLKWNLRPVRPKNGFSNFLDFLYLGWLSRYKITIEIDFFFINGERLVAAEHTVFKFEDLKVNSRDDRQTDRVTE